jgi:hypothetical protein
MQFLSRPADSGVALAVCPLCQKVAAFTTMGDVSAGGAWRCDRCGQSWDADRLTAVAAYARYVAIC